MSYTSKILVQNYLQRDLNEHEEAFLMVLVPTIERWLDNKMGATYGAASETTRYYDGGGTSIDIDPCTSITDVDSVNEDNSDGYDYTDLTEYIALPANETVKTELVKRHGRFPRGVGNIKVVAKFSEYDGGVPQDIQTIATIMASEVLNQGAVGSTGVVKSESLEGHSITYETSSSSLDGIASTNPNIKSLLDMRREILLG